MNKTSLLPKMPFGEMLAHSSDDIKLFTQKMSNVITSLQYYDLSSDSKIFKSKSYVFETSGFKAVSSANTPVTIMVGDTHDVTLMIPFFGENLSTVENKGYRWKANHHAILLPKTGRGGSSTLRSTLTIDLNPSRLKETAISMLGYDKDILLDFKLNEPRLIPLFYGNVSFIEPIKSICNMIDTYQCNEDLLKHFQVDELFYRIIVTMLMPEKFFDHIDQPESKPKSNYSKTITLVLEYAENHPNFFQTLSDIERFTGLSTRALQYAFAKILGTTPKQWLLKQRIQAARKMIIEGEGNISVTRAAMECGFSNFSIFAKYYRNEFKELPSETLKKIKLF